MGKRRTTAAGRRLPAEWEPQAAVLMAWPHTGTDWAPVLRQVRPVFAAIGAAITRRAHLLLVVPPGDDGSAAAALARAGADLLRITFFAVPTNDTWTRDYGPLTVVSRAGPWLLSFAFNGWGLKFAANLDNQVTRRLHAAGAFGRVPLREVPMVLEGGSIDSDGAGTLLTTTACLREANRNPALSPRDLEWQLQQATGARRVLWLEHGCLEGDNTDGHIDTLARFAPGDAIVYTACRAPRDSHYRHLQAMHREICGLRTLAGKPYRLFPLPWPQPKRARDGHRLPATYANFLIVNGAVLVPTYRDPADAAALAVIRQAFPGYEVTGIDCLPLLVQHGSLHCLTMHMPPGVASC